MSNLKVPGFRILVILIQGEVLDSLRSPAQGTSRRPIRLQNTAGSMLFVQQLLGALTEETGKAYGPTLKPLGHSPKMSSLETSCLEKDQTSPGQSVTLYHLESITPLLF